MTVNRLVLLCVVYLFSFLCKAENKSETIQTPSAFFGFQPGADRMLLDYETSIAYLQQLAALSPRVKMIEIGESPMGKKMYIVLFSSSENIENIDRLKQINKELATNPDLSEDEVAEFCKEGKVFIMATLSMHATEVGPAQAAPLVAYKLATSNDIDLAKQLKDVVYMMVPSSNPDGMDMIVHHYMDTKDTKYEGCSYPGVYNKYVGHDNNRDYVTLSQKDNKAIARIYNTDWYPQVLIDKHQMGSTGARYFVPPNCDPIAENVDEKVWNWSWIFGSNLAKDMTAKGLKGITQHSIFDNYWPGSTETGIWKNMISMLTECASVQLAKPIYIEKSELKGGGTGLAEYKKSINMPAPWEGGWWRLNDIVSYEMASSLSLIKTASFHKKDVLLNRNILCKESYEKGKTLAPAYFVFPAKQHDKSELFALLNLLDEHGVCVYTTTEELVYENKIIEKGSYIVPLAQPYRPFVKEVLDIQKYPERHFTPDGELMRPYDITSWCLPYHQGVSSYKIEKVVKDIEDNVAKVNFPIEFTYKPAEDCKTLVFSVKNNESFKVAFAALKKGIEVGRVTEKFTIGATVLEKGDFVVAAGNKKLNDIYNLLTVAPKELSERISENIKELEFPKIALIETVFSDMDAGWTRFVFDSYNIPFTALKPELVKTEDLSKFDVIVFPNTEKSVLINGKRERGKKVSIPNYDARYIKGMGKEGLQKVLKFENDGGTVLSWGASTELFMGIQSIKVSDEEKEEFELPVNNISSQLKEKGFYAPGTMLNVDLTEHHPLTLGLPKTVCIFVRNSPIFATSIPYFDTDRRVVATYTENDILASGYAENEKLLEGKTAMVWAQKGKGNFVLYGFNPQFRASTSGTYKLLFNALLLE